jgi:hypothetical protein
MATPKPKPSEIQDNDVLTELQKAEDAIVKVQQQNAKRLRQLNKAETEKQEAALFNYRVELANKKEQLTLKKQIAFLAQYEQIRKQNSERDVRNESNQRQRALIDYHKYNSSQAEKERKKEEEKLKKELEIAKLLDTTGKTPEQIKTDTKKADNLKNQEALLGSIKELGSNLGKGLLNIGDKLSGEINSVISTFAQYQSAVNTRLQGTATTFQAVQKTLTSTMGQSPFVKTSSMLESLNELVAQGIAFNIEQRAFLDSLGDKIATTFDIANASLLRIVKLQQEDSSASRLGMEAYLTRYFNEMFKDTQYLSQTFDSVTDALVEATSQMGTKQAVEFEYIVQKWLGSLSAVGTSESTIRSLAEAIGYLGAGDVTALSGSNMQNLIVTAASRAGLNYSDMLTGGIDAFETNELLKEVVTYMQEIGMGSNQVVKSQFAQTFGLSISDLTAAKNIGDDIGKITANMMSYQGTIEELGYQLNQIAGRVSEAEKIQNVMTNIKFGIGQGIAENAVMAGMWAITDLIQNVTGGIAIPAISVMGNMVDLNTTVENLIKTGLVGASTLGKLPDLFKGLSQSGNLSSVMGSYGITNEPTRIGRGTGLTSRTAGMTTSQVTTVGSSDSSAILEFEEKKAKKPLQQKLEEEKEKQKTTEDVHTYLVGTLTPQLTTITEALNGVKTHLVGTMTSNLTTMIEAQQTISKIEQKTSNDVLNYLIYLLDPKLTTMTQMLGSMSNFQVSTGQFSSGIIKQDNSGSPDNQPPSNYVLNYGTSVSVSQPVESQSSKNYEKLESLASNVSEIHKLLKNGITVNMSTSAGLIGGLTQ